MKKTTVIVAMFLSACILIGCGSTKPSGTYTRNNVSFKFEKSQVTVVEGTTSVKSSYKMDSNGNITFDLEGESITISYDKEKDVISARGFSYSKQ